VPIVEPWCGQILENTEKDELLVRTTAIGVPSTAVVATPPTVASAGKSEILIDAELSDFGDVTESPPTPHAANAAIASAAAPKVTKSRRLIPAISGCAAPHAQAPPQTVAGPFVV
jgi:hypothetical protein